MSENLIFALFLIFAGLAFFGYWALSEETRRLREQNSELIDKFMFNKQPDRIVKARFNTDMPATSLKTVEGMGDPVSVAERLAEKAAQEQNA